MAIVGLIVNVFVASWLNKGAKRDLNIKSALYHVIGDALASIGVIIGGVVIYLAGKVIFDPLVSIAIALIILSDSVRILQESSRIFIEGVPRDIDLNRAISR